MYKYVSVWLLLSEIIKYSIFVSAHARGGMYTTQYVASSISCIQYIMDCDIVWIIKTRHHIMVYTAVLESSQSPSIAS